MNPHRYDVIVIGGGHAGIEAATASARIGARTCLLTISLDQIGTMSCNPAIGGVAKGQIAREVDALGGCMGRLIDATGIHFRMLNTSKGPAVASPRAQADKDHYRRAAKQMVEQTPNLTLVQGEVSGLLVQMIPARETLDRELRGPDGRYIHPPSEPVFRIAGVRTGYGLELLATRVVITTGTFLGGKLHFGDAQVSGGRAGEAASLELTDSLARIGLQTGRLKTGTPARLDGRSIDYHQCEVQPADETPQPFSFLTERITQEMMTCWITRTNEATHTIIADNMLRSPVYSGAIAGKGPRYCPSIEDKVKRFADKTNHQVFLEPEGRDTHEIYANGISSSLPFDVQDAFIRTIPGLQQAHITRYGYAVEYDFVFPHQLSRGLECRSVEGLFLAGQINGTTGYEEAAAQGLVAGANAALSLKGEERLNLGRHEAYIGVLVDDLTTRSTDEPYRMFTSLAEFRLRLRQDNADRRLTPVAARLGLVGATRAAAVQRKEASITALTKFLATRFVDGSGQSLLDRLRRPEVSVEALVETLKDTEPQLAGYSPEVLRQVEIDAKYAGYLMRQDRDVERLRKLEGVRIPGWLSYAAITPLRKEAQEKFTRHQPQTLGQASRIAGIGPSDIGVLEVYLRSKPLNAASQQHP